MKREWCKIQELKRHVQEVMCGKNGGMLHYQTKARFREKF